MSVNCAKIYAAGFGKNGLFSKMAGSVTLRQTVILLAKCQNDLLEEVLVSIQAGL